MERKGSLTETIVFTLLNMCTNSFPCSMIGVRFLQSIGYLVHSHFYFSLVYPKHFGLFVNRPLSYFAVATLTIKEALVFASCDFESIQQ